MFRKGKIITTILALSSILVAGLIMTTSRDQQVVKTEATGMPTAMEKVVPTNYIRVFFDRQNANTASEWDRDVKLRYYSPGTGDGGVLATKISHDMWFGDVPVLTGGGFAFSVGNMGTGGTFPADQKDNWLETVWIDYNTFKTSGNNYIRIKGPTDQDGSSGYRYNIFQYTINWGQNTRRIYTKLDPAVTNWTNVYVHYWQISGTNTINNVFAGTWPGQPMTYDSNMELWYADIPLLNIAYLSKVIFNNGGATTGNTAESVEANLKDNNYAVIGANGTAKRTITYQEFSPTMNTVRFWLQRASTPAGSYATLHYWGVGNWDIEVYPTGSIVNEGITLYYYDLLYEHVKGTGFNYQFKTYSSTGVYSISSTPAAFTSNENNFIHYLSSTTGRAVELIGLTSTNVVTLGKILEAYYTCLDDINLGYGDFGTIMSNFIFDEIGGWKTVGLMDEVIITDYSYTINQGTVIYDYSVLRDPSNTMTLQLKYDTMRIAFEGSSASNVGRLGANVNENLRTALIVIISTFVSLTAVSFIVLKKKH